MSDVEDLYGLPKAFTQLQQKTQCSGVQNDTRIVGRMYRPLRW